MPLEAGRMNLRRKLLVSSGRVRDRVAEVAASQELKLSQRGTLRSGKHDDLLLGSLEESIGDAYRALPATPPHDPALLDFLGGECRMVAEHQDGSFLDHLQCGYEYAARHFPGHSPRVLLLHSIMGLGNNHFPMGAEKIPKLRSLVTDFEFRHVEAFPTVVRLWGHGQLPAELLRSTAQQLSGLSGIKFRRVIDNLEVSLSARDFWIQLNYQLVHYTDFFPVAFWSSADDDASLLIFRIYCSELVTVLSRAGMLLAHVDFEPDVGVKDAPESCQLRRRMQRWEKISAKIGHNLHYSIQWGAEGIHRPRASSGDADAGGCPEGGLASFPMARL